MDKQDLTNALFWACRENDVKTAVRLLKDGADPNFIEEDIGNTFLYNSSSLELSRALIEHGADVNLRSSRMSAFDNASNVNFKFYIREETALMKAKSIEIARLLIESGADLTIKDSDGRLAHENPYFDDKLEVKKYLKSCHEDYLLTHAAASTATLGDPVGQMVNQRERL